jgi:hypothetical protein
LNAQIEEAYGWRVVLIGYGIVVLVGVTLLSMLVRDRPEPYGLLPDGDPRRRARPRNALPAHPHSAAANQMPMTKGPMTPAAMGAPGRRPRTRSMARVPNMVLPTAPHMGTRQPKLTPTISAKGNVDVRGTRSFILLQESKVV